MKEEYVHLQYSESIIAQMSATIFASFVQKQEYSPANEDVLVERSVAIAVKLANCTEKCVKSDDEWVKKNTGSAFLGG